MGRLPPLVWLLALLLLLPTPLGRALIDVIGGVALVLLALPVILGGVGWIGVEGVAKPNAGLSQLRFSIVASNPSLCRLWVFFFNSRYLQCC